MELVLLSGGSGKRLWPLSNNVRSKQFLKILKYNGKMESMVPIQFSHQNSRKIIIISSSFSSSFRISFSSDSTEEIS